jgi:myo-inositol-1(or 4)-monophosphatase
VNEAELDAREGALAVVVRDAGEVAKKHFSSPSNVKLKGKQDFITAADGELERLIIERLKARFPGDAFLGEEGGVSGELTATSAAVWVIDPIDGTANFAYRIPHFCVSIALMSAGKLLLGAIAAPMYGELYRARAGRGAFLNDRPMRAADITDLRQAIIELGWSARRPVRAYTGLLERVLDAGATFMRAGSGALGLAYVAAGRTHGYCELHINSWDTLAGLLMVREAGGWTNDYLAGEALQRGNAVLACAPGLREALVDVTGVGQATETTQRRTT